MIVKIYCAWCTDHKTDQWVVYSMRAETASGTTLMKPRKQEMCGGKKTWWGAGEKLCEVFLYMNFKRDSQHFLLYN